jgi:hypothetical protein
VIPGAEWSVRNKRFDGVEAAVVSVSAGCSHAIRNDGRHEMQIVGLSNRVYNAADPDVYRRKVV